MALAALTGSCAVDRGRGFGTLEEATLTARLETGDGHSPDEPLETELGYFVRLSDVRLQVGGVGLLALRNEALETSDGFDPANPPPGYTLCHGGHCHAEDGSLVDYADIEAELGESGEAQTVSVVSMPCEHELDLYALRRIELDTVLPSRELPRTQLDRAEVWVRRLRVSGEVWGGPEFGGFGEERVGLDVDLEAGGALVGEADFVVDEDTGAFAVEVELEVGVHLLHHLDYGPEVAGGVVSITDPDSEAGSELIEHLLESHVHVRFH